MPPTIGLAMLVKDEEKALPATLQRVLPIIDAYTVIDTGSTDKSRQIVMDTLRDIPGDLIEWPFEGFGPARTQLLSFARDRADYTLMLDADHILHVHGDKPKLTADAYLIRVRGGGDQWRLPLLTRSKHPFEYRGAAHAYLASDLHTVQVPCDWLSIDGGGGVTRAKLERDRQLLEADHAAQPDNPRTIFYLAQTYRDLDMREHAIRFYLLRASMGGWAEEVYWARYQAGCLLSEHVSFSQGADQLLQAWKDRPTRIEALRALANAANAVADKAPLPRDSLFVRTTAYRKAA